jgi:hypothetical protein
MKKICLIFQPAGIGDVFFLQKMIDFYISEDYKVVYPLLPQLMYIKDYIKKENLEFYSVEDNFPFKEKINHNNLILEDDFIFIPTHIADRIYPNMSCMESKYKLVNMDYSDWMKYFSFERNIEKENSLYYDVLKLTDNDTYTLINNTWGTPPNTASKPIEYEQNEKIINIKIIPEFTVFDWCKVIENASHISIVDTSLNYIIETLELKSKKNFLTSRFTPSNFSHIINLFKKEWVYL